MNGILDRKCRTVLKSVLTQLWCTCGTCGTFALAAQESWRAIYVGPSMPAAEIAGVAFQHARVVALSLVYPVGDPNIERELRALRGFLPKNVTILAGGRAAGKLPDGD